MERFQSQRPGDESPAPLPFRLLHPEDELLDEETPPCGDDLSPGQVSPNIRLAQFFHRWYRPIVIDGQGLSHGTLILYVQLLKWWKRLTTDPPLRMIDLFTVTTFAARLRKATYRRGPLGGERPLSPHRVASILRNLRSLLGRIGPQRDPSKPTAKLIDDPPAVPVDDVECDPKPCFSLETARAIVAAAGRMEVPRLEGIEPWQWWRGTLGGYYVTSLRRGSLLECEWTMLHKDAICRWLLVPGRLVCKTGKSKKIALPDWYWRSIAWWPQRGAKIFCWPYHIDHLNDCHYQLQSLAGIPEAEQMPIQAWRRTHGQAMGNEGLAIAQKLAQLALDHGDSGTTRKHYVDFENQVRLRLPPLWDDAPIDDRQKRLF